MKAVVVGIAITCVACKGKADCDGTLSAAFERVAKTEFKVLLEGQRDRFDKYWSSLRSGIMERCRTDGWTPKTIECFVGSKKQSDVQSCGSTFSAEQMASLRSTVAETVKPYAGDLLHHRPFLDKFGYAQDELREATRQLVAAGLPSDPRGATADEDMTHAREIVMSEQGVPLAPLEAAVHLAIQYRLEVAMPALILARPAK